MTVPTKEQVAELADLARIVIDLGERMGRRDEAPSNIYNVAADLATALEALQAELERVERERDQWRANAHDLRDQLQATEIQAGTQFARAARLVAIGMRARTLLNETAPTLSERQLYDATR